MKYLIYNYKTCKNKIKIKIKMKIIVKNISGKKDNIEINNSSTLQDLKNKIEEIKPTPNNRVLKLIFSGEILKNDQEKLEFYKITDGSCIVAMTSKKLVNKKDNLIKTDTEEIDNVILPNKNNNSNNNLTNSANEADDIAKNIYSDDKKKYLESNQDCDYKLNFPNENDATRLLNNYLLNTHSKEDYTALMNRVKDEINQGTINLDDMMLENKNLYNSNQGNGIYNVDVTEEEYNDIVELEKIGVSTHKAYSAYINTNKNLENARQMLLLSKENSHDNVIGLTTNDNIIIKELTDMGFAYNDVIQYYLACDKNKEAVINILLEL